MAVGGAGFDRRLDPCRPGTTARSVQGLDRGAGGRGLAAALSAPGTDRSDEDELWLAFGRAIGFTLAAILLLVGGGILVIVLAAVFFGFIFGG